MGRDKQPQDFEEHQIARPIARAKWLLDPDATTSVTEVVDITEPWGMVDFRVIFHLELFSLVIPWLKPPKKHWGNLLGGMMFFSSRFMANKSHYPVVICFIAMRITILNG